MALTNKVYVGDLPDTVEEDEIKQVFEPFGEVTEVELKSTFAFVHMANSNEAEEAIAKLNNTELSGSLIRVERPRPRRGGFRGGQRGGGAGGGGGGGDNCFNCGLPGHWQRECRKGRNGGGTGGGSGGFSGRAAGFGGGGGFGGSGGGGFGGGGYQQGGFSSGRFDGAPRGRGARGGGGVGGFGGRGGRGRGNCFICNSPEHWSRECPDNQNAQGAQKY